MNKPTGDGTHSARQNLASYMYSLQLNLNHIKTTYWVGIFVPAQHEQRTGMIQHTYTDIRPHHMSCSCWLMLLRKISERKLGWTCIFTDKSAWEENRHVARAASTYVNCQNQISIYIVSYRRQLESDKYIVSYRRPSYHAPVVYLSFHLCRRMMDAKKPIYKFTSLRKW